MTTEELIELLSRIIAGLPPQLVKLRVETVALIVRRLAEHDDIKLLDDWLAVQAEPSVDGWIEVEARLLTWALHGLKRA